jgi:hypothetical protein
MLALALASALPCAALLWPGAVPQEIVVLSLVAWAGIFVVALWSAWAEDRRRRKGQGETASGPGATSPPRIPSPRRCGSSGRAPGSG